MAEPTPTPLPPDIAAQTRAPTILALMYSFFILACLCVAGRVFSRLKKIGRLLVDDYILLLSLALETTSTGLLTAGIGYGMGRHSAVLSIPDFEHAVMCTLIGLSFAAISFTVTKIAVAILIINVLHPSPWNVRVLVGLTVGNVLIMTASVMIYYFQCGTPQALWTVGMNAKCLDPLVAYGAILGACALSALTDFYFALYPAIAIWSLDITRRKKFALCIALGFGVFAGSVAIYKCTTVGLLMDRTDYTYNTEGVIVWTSIEASCIIIAASIPLLLPLVELWFGTRLLSGRIYLRSIKTTFRRITTFRDTGKGNTTIKTCSSIPITVSHHDTLGTINAGDTRPQ